ncbi:DciA family protein [Holophaga foetida]|uniref:DciA family protein n=1 Tax=Holophaga foetida TaxID=35839 RepID=UPI0002471750|nr:DciA family protein [Holophaga foetida]
MSFPRSRFRSKGLSPIREAGLKGREAVEARMEQRLRRAWPLIVGPLLMNHTRLLRVRAGILLVGCWQVSAIQNLRLSAEATWPQVQERIKRMLKLDLQRIEIVPCDPPPPPAAPLPPKDEDPLLAVLELLRQRRKEG